MPALPEDLVAFLRAERRLEYALAKCEARLVTLLPAGALKVESFPMDCQITPIEEDDRHYREMGCYLAPAGNLVSVAATGFVLIPLALRAFEWWLLPRLHGLWRMTAAGDALIIGLYTLSVAVFAFLGHLADRKTYRGSARALVAFCQRQGRGVPGREG